MAPIALSDSELGCVMALAKNTPPVMRRSTSALSKHRAWTQMMEQ
jgi:hypothetical protein